VAPGLDALAHYLRGPRPHCRYIHGNTPPPTCTADRRRGRMAARLEQEMTR
jgi:hypothetical protein